MFISAADAGRHRHQGRDAAHPVRVVAAHAAVAAPGAGGGGAGGGAGRAGAGRRDAGRRRAAAQVGSRSARRLHQVLTASAASASFGSHTGANHAPPHAYSPSHGVWKTWTFEPTHFS